MRRAGFQIIYLQGLVCNRTTSIPSVQSSNSFATLIKQEDKMSDVYYLVTLNYGLTVFWGFVVILQFVVNKHSLQSPLSLSLSFQQQKLRTNVTIDISLSSIFIHFDASLTFYVSCLMNLNNLCFWMCNAKCVSIATSK